MEIVTTSFKRRKLPHWEVEGKAYFVTFRLRHSLPKESVLKLQTERNKLLSDDVSSEILYKFQRYEFQEIEKVLDSIDNNDFFFSK